MYKDTKPTQLIFVNDLMIFVKQKRSLLLVIQVLHHYSSVTGLVTNIKKPNFFYAGVNDETVERFPKLNEFTIGTLPIKYFGLLFLRKNRIELIATY